MCSALCSTGASGSLGHYRLSGTLPRHSRQRSDVRRVRDPQRCCAQHWYGCEELKSAGYTRVRNATNFATCPKSSGLTLRVHSHPTKLTPCLIAFIHVCEAPNWNLTYVTLQTGTSHMSRSKLEPHIWNDPSWNLTYGMLQAGTSHMLTPYPEPHIYTNLFYHYISLISALRAQLLSVSPLCVCLSLIHI